MQCPTPIQKTDLIKLGHGSGGKLTADLIGRTFLYNLGDSFCGQLEDAAVLPFQEGLKVAITTDSYVVKPYRFPGGDIGSLAIHGTVNDLAVRGAKPLYVTAAFIIEEGFPVSELDLLVQSMRRACEQSGIVLAAADTKVVQRGACDKIFITTTGVGSIEQSRQPSVSATRVGDSIVVSGEIGMHGMAVMCAREDLQFEHTLLSDSAPLHELSAALLRRNDIHSMRDITRGGLISVLCEIAEMSGVGIEIDETAIPVHPQVAAACELLGLDPLYVACEGRLVATCTAPNAKAVVSTMHSLPISGKACLVGSATADHKGKVILRSSIGGRRFVDKLSGDQLPRIC
jgi:hydrogenase expression/formation protein HypE